MEKSFISKYGGLIILLLVISNIYFFASKTTGNVSGENDKEQTTEPSFKNYVLELGKSVINCEFKVTSTFSFKNTDGSDQSKVHYRSGEESSSVNIIFSGLDTTSPIMKTNNGEDPLMIISNDDQQITMGTTNMSQDLFIYKVYKDSKIATWYKSYDLLGTPFALLSMGYCY